MNKTCIVLSEEEDIHVRQVISHLDTYKDWNCVILDTEFALTNLAETLYIDSVSKVWTGTVAGLDMSAIRSIWYRRPKRPRFPDSAIDADMAKLAEAEMQAMLKNFYRIAQCRILPHPDRDLIADYKLVQLVAAASVGLEIPLTSVSNEANWIDRFPSSMEHFCIKALSSFHWWSDPYSEYSLRSARVSRSDLVRFAEDVKLCPIFVQEYVEKKYEWRVTVVDRSVFACRLDSQSVTGAEEDWRQIDVDQIPHEFRPLPETVADKLLGYLRYFDLNFGAFDLIEKPDGTFVFLECNPNGQWLWIELLTGAPISKAIADYLFAD